MNTKLFLLVGTSLSLIPNITFAQCVATQDCETLGYTETSCNGGKGVKCPFGNKWACLTSEEECLNLACDKLGFSYTCTGTGEHGVGNDCNGKYQGCTCDSIYQYTCSGTGYAGGVGSACGGKYTSCICASEYEWKDGSCKISCTNLSNGAYSNVYCCNGAVVGVKASSMNFYVAMQDLGQMNGNSANSQCQNYSFCGNVKGTLPTKDQLVTLYNNKSQINTLLSTSSGIKIAEGFYWSSTKYINNSNFYTINMSSGGLSGSGYVYDHYVRPVLTSW